MVAANNFGQYLFAVRQDRDAVRQEGYAETRPNDDDQDFSDYMGVPTPKELLAIYRRGFQGAGVVGETPPPGRFGDLPSFYTLFPWAKDIGKGKLCLAYLPVLAFEKDYGTWEPQTRGSCVSHGTRNGGMCDYAADALMGATEYRGRFCTENIYRWRGHRGCGADCYTLSYCVGKNGKSGFLVRGKYGEIDLTTFSSKTESWGAAGGSGHPEIDAIAAQNKSLSVFRCDSPEEERDAHACGFGTNGCSSLGFASSTDEHGLAEQRGLWAHSMARAATNDTEWAHRKYGGMTELTVQSWGKWNKINGMPDGVKHVPGGSFWVRSKLFRRYSIYGYADVVGFGRGYDDARDYLVERAKRIEELSIESYDTGKVPCASA
jgi:hypothetical protein